VASTPERTVAGDEPDQAENHADSGVDRAQIQAHLAMTPDQRLEALTNMSRFRRSIRRVAGPGTRPVGGQAQLDG
jgi:hypothetical protein